MGRDIDTIRPYIDYPKCRIVYEGRPKGAYGRIKDVTSLFPIAAALFGECVNHHEECYCLFLNRKNDLAGVLPVSVGGIDGTIVDLKIIMQGALLCNASGAVLMHNHPSGDETPGGNDMEVTGRLRKALETFEAVMCVYGVLAAAFTGGLVWAMVCELREYGRRNDIK